MIYIKEILDRDDGVVEIQVEGILNYESLPALEEACDRHLENGRRLLLKLDTIIHISRDGQKFLRNIKAKGNIVTLPKFYTLKDHE